MGPDSLMTGALPCGDASLSAGITFVVSGPSGVGKDTVLRELLALPNAPPGLLRLVTATTRLPRTGEADGVDYHFLADAEFERRRATGGFLECVRYAGAQYGTPLAGLAEARDRGHDVILKIEVRGAAAVREQIPEAVLVFLAPPSEDELLRRLARRDTEDGISREERLRTAREEMRMAARYDYIIRNDHLVRAVDALRCIIVASRLRTRRPAAELP